MKNITLMWVVGVLLGTAIQVSHAKSPKWTITTQGFGPVTTGMTLQRASKVLGVKLSVGTVDRQADSSGQCAYTLPIKAYPNLSFMLIDGKIARADLSMRSLKPKKYSVLMTDKGIRIGDSEKKVKMVYAKKSLKVEPHKYGDGNDFYLTYWTTPQQKSGIRYETTNGVVTHIQGGNATIEWVEGCS